MPNWNAQIRSPYLFLILGIISMLAAAVFTWTGKVWVRFNGWVYRDQEPGSFWSEVAILSVIGVCFVGYSLYRIFYTEF